METVAGGYPGGGTSGETVQSEPKRGRPRGRAGAPGPPFSLGQLYLRILEPTPPWPSPTLMRPPHPHVPGGGSGLDFKLNSSTSLASCGLLPPGIPRPLGHPDPARRLSNRHQDWPRCLKAISSPAGRSLARALSGWLSSRPSSHSPLDTGSNSSPYSGLAHSQARS